MEFRFIPYFLLAGILTFVHDVFNIGDGLMLIVALFYWRGFVHLFRFERAERDNGE